MPSAVILPVNPPDQPKIYITNPRIDNPLIGATRACPDCGRPQHYTGTEHGWAHDALIDTWHCADPHKGMSDYRRAVEDGADPRAF